MNPISSTTPAIDTATATECTYSFRAAYRHHRHLAPGTHACLLVEDSFGAALRSETGWVEVLACSDDGVYLGRLITPLDHFAEIRFGQQVHFTLDHVLEANGQVIAA
ncbi:hypothetical protein [Deinococcus sp. AJ005]|uniref:hypothetical protein n=1 Tax=Deinococcus sp. AJ005 TaxID=2652443 RepID=UPI00125CC9C5|nr:hypothetical protein [Deinococcus sp. AJ005]QFP77456.1 hypothetical protein DAAJ005_14035 [Deinococcus sp. AJ005]